MKMLRTKSEPIPQLYTEMADRCGAHSSALLSGLREGNLLKMESSARALLGQVKAMVDLMDMRKQEVRHD